MESVQQRWEVMNKEKDHATSWQMFNYLSAKDFLLRQYFYE